MSDQVSVSKYAPVPGKIPGTVVNLGGRDFILAPLNLNQVEHLEETIRNLNDLQGKSISEAVKAATPIVLASLLRNYPDITAEDVALLLDVGNFSKAIKAVVSTSGFKESAPGETLPAG